MHLHCITCYNDACCKNAALHNARSERNMFLSSQAPPLSAAPDFKETWVPHSVQTAEQRQANLLTYGLPAAHFLFDGELLLASANQ